MLRSGAWAKGVTSRPLDSWAFTPVDKPAVVLAKQKMETVTRTGAGKRGISMRGISMRGGEGGGFLSDTEIH